MICPKCGSEYREGFTRCGDCNVDLIQPKQQRFSRHELESDSIESEDEEEEEELVEILETQHSGLLGELTYRLERKQIPYLEQSGTLYGSSIGGRRINPHTWAGKVWVPAAFEEKAKEILSKISQEKFSEISPAPTEDSE